MLKEELVHYDPETGRMLSPPQQVFLDLTSRCNLDCVTCSVDYGRDPPDYAMGDMSLATIDRLRPWLTTAKSINLNIVGEPLIHGRFSDVLALLDASEPNVHFNTNGLGLRPAMCERLVDGPVRSLAVSLDGMESNQPIRGIPYETIRERIVHLITARDRAQSRTPEIGLAYTLMRRNLHELPRVLQDLLPLGIDMVHVQPLIVFYESLADQNPYDVEGVDEVLGECAEIARAHSVRFTAFRSRFNEDERYQPPEPDDLQVGGTSATFGCIDPFYEIKIRHNGQALACSYGLSLGLDVHTLELDELWNHPAYTALRKRLARQSFEGRCQGCPYVFGSSTAQASAIRPGVRHSREERFFQS